MNWKGRQRYRQKNKKGKYEKWSDWYPNLFVDDGIELTLDFLFGLKSWWNPKDQGDYEGGDSGWNTQRSAMAGVCMFNNASPERATGLNGIPSGDEYDYPVDDTMLVSPEDSFLSRPTGSSVVPIIKRRDQTVEFSISFDVPGDIPSGTPLREVAIFLTGQGPTKDPSGSDSNKPFAMVARSVYGNTGYYNEAGQTGQQGEAGFKLCYTDNPLVVTNDIDIQYEFGEL